MEDYYKDSNQKERFYEVTKQLESDVKVKPTFAIQIVHKRIKRQLTLSVVIMVPAQITHTSIPVID